MSGRHGREDLDAMERIPDALEVLANDPDAAADALDAADAARRRRRDELRARGAWARARRRGNDQDGTRASA